MSTYDGEYSLYHIRDSHVDKTIVSIDMSNESD